MPRLVLCLSLIVPLLATSASAQDGDNTGDSPFARQTIDVGLVCRDVEKSKAFYQEAIGFEEAGAFDVPAETAGDAGLSDELPFHIEVLALGEDETATKLKLMSFPQAPGARQDQRFIHSTLGVSYLTIFVKDLNAAVERAREHGAKPLGKGITPLPKEIAEGIGIALVRDPDGNFVEVVGPVGE